MPRTFTEEDFADAPATGRVFTEADFAPEEEPSIAGEGLKAIARAGLRIGKSVMGTLAQAPPSAGVGAPGIPTDTTARDRSLQVADMYKGAEESVAEAPGLQDRPWNDPVRLASAGGEMLPATAAVLGSAVLSGGASIPALVAGGLGGMEQLQRGTEEGDPNAGTKAMAAGAFDAATSFLPFHIIGKIASPALKAVTGAVGMSATNPIVAAARALLTGDDPRAAAYESLRNTPINAIQGTATGLFAPESAGVRGRKVEAGRKAAADKAVMDAAVEESVRAAQELNDWDSAWSEAGRLNHERLLAEQRAAKNATLAPPDQTGSMAPDQAAALRARDTELALKDQSPEFSDLRLAPESLDANPLSQVDTDNPITPRIYPKEGKMPELPDMVSSPETSEPKPALPDVEKIQDFPAAGPDVGKVGVEPMLPPGRIRGNRTAPTIIPDLPAKPGLLAIDPMTGGPEPPRIGPDGSPVFAPGPPVPEIGGIGGGQTVHRLPGPTAGGLGVLSEGPTIDPYAGMAGHLTPGGFPAMDPRMQAPPLSGLGGADPVPVPFKDTAGGLGQLSEGPRIRPFEAMRDVKGNLTFRRAAETPTMPQETTSPEPPQVPVAPESAQPAPAAAAESTPAPAAEQPWRSSYYHASGATDIQSFHTEGSGGVYGGEVGTHFGTLEQAQKVLDRRGGGKIYEASVDVKNPIRLEDTGHFSQSAILMQLKKRGIISNQEWESHALGGKAYDVRDILQSKGYDGIIYDNVAEGGGDSVIAFRPEQISVKPSESPSEAVPGRKAKAPDAPAPASKQPWEMTREEWVKAQGKRVSGQSVGKTQKLANSLHKDFVKIWLSEGKPVPPEVLADYPDLAPAAVEPVPAAEPQPAPAAAAESASGVVSFDKAKRGDVYGVTIGGKPRFAIRENMDNPRGAGDHIYDSPEEARQEYAKDQERKSLNASRQAEGEAKKKAQDEKDNVAKTARTDIRGFMGDAPALQQGRTRELLTGKPKYQHEGERLTGRDLVDKLTGRGYEPRTVEDTDHAKLDTAYKKLQNTTRMSPEEQRNYERTISDPPTKTYYRLYGKDGNYIEVSKVEHDYAQHLASKPDFTNPETGALNLTAMRDLPGALVDLAKKAGRKIARGNDPEGLQPIKEERANVLSSLGWGVQKALGEYDDAVKSEYKKSERPAIELLANEALQGRTDARDSSEARMQSEAAMAKLAPKTRAAVKKARALLDKTSQQLVDNGIGTDTTLSTVKGNLGIWAKRSYQVFDDPSHLAAVEASPKWNDWAEQRATLERQRGNSVTVEEAKALNKAMLAKMAEEGQGRYLTNTTLGKSDLSSFKQRNEIPLWMREMMGQYADFRVNFTKSAKSNANMIANHGFQEQVAALGAGKFIFDKPTDAAYVQFPASSEYGALANKFTTPEFRDTLQGIIGAKQNGPIDQLLAATSSVARFNKTAGNFPRGTFRQLPSNLKAGLQAGHVTPGTFLTPAGWDRVAKSGKIAWSALRGRENVNVAQVMDDLYARGVLDSDAIQSLQKESVEDVTGPQSKLGQSRLGRTRAGRKALDATKKITDSASNIYMTFDNLQKANGYLAEMDLYAHKVKSGEWTVEQLKDHAANVVKDVYPTRVRVLNAAEKGRNVPLVADFVFYKSERLRNNVSLLKRIGQEINDPDPKTKMIGWKRAAGLMAGMAGAPALLAAANLKNGVDSDKDKAWRDLAGDRLPWLENTSLAYTDHGSGKAKVMDIGYMDSDQQITDAVRALIEGKNWQSGMADSMQQFLGEFVGLNMATNIVTGLIAGVDPETQKPIASKGDEWLQQQLSKVNWAFKKGEPGTLTLARQANEAWKGKRSAAEVALSVAGPASYHLDAKDLLKSSIYEYRDTVMAQRTKVNRAKKIDPATGGSAKAGANENLKVSFRALNEKVKAAKKVGLKQNEIRAILKDAGFSQDDQTKILNNVWNSRELGIK